MVGDIPIRTGDRVTKSTILTTVDENDVLEIYVNVPVQEAPKLSLGLPVRIVDDRGQVLATNKVTFISPSVDDTTQSVLAKAALVEGRGKFRPDQFVRVRVLWRSAPGITVPMTAVTRVSGQFFVFVAEKQGEMTVARQHAVTLGDMIGNDYLLINGLKAGDQLIVSGIQKIGDGAPVMVGGPAPPREEGVLAMVADVFIRRPVLSTVCSLLIILAGAIAIPTLPIARYPDLAPPSVTVSAFYTGANAQAVESAVTTPLEQAINGIEGMTYITSSSTNSGFATITVTFDVSRNPDLAAVDVQNRVNQALGRMPADVRTNGITVTKNTAGFMGGLGFFSRDNRYDSQFISNYVDLYVRDAIKRVPGVGNVIIFGERRFAMRMWLDPARMAGLRLTAGDVMSALREQNVQVAAGALGDAPSAADQQFTLSVRAMGRLSEPREFEDIVVKAGKDGALVRIRDIGRVELGAETYASTLRFLGLEAQGVGVQLLPSANALEVYDGVIAEMKRLEKNFPPGLEWQVAFDNVTVVRESIVEVLKTLAEAIGLVILVMFLFLQNWRSTIIPAVTIPVSLIGTFAFVKLFGFSINTLTLFGIVLATGIVVDDAIVVIENIERHMSEFKKTARRAAIDAMREVFGAVVVIGIVLVAVFVPVAFFPGVTGRLYQQFSLTIAFAVVLSVFNAVTLTPALSALLLDRESHTHGFFFTAINRVIDGGTRFYVAVVRARST